MRFLLLLLPNIYDIFTALAIGYAYFVDKQTPLKIPFLFACIVIYVATRLGIFAGQIVGMMSGQVNEEPADVNDADAFAKKLIWGFVPQLIGVIIFQVIMAFCYLPSIPGMPKAQQVQQAQPAQQLFNNNKNAAASAQQAEPSKNIANNEVAEPKAPVVQDKVSEEENFSNSAKPVEQKPMPKMVSYQTRKVTAQVKPAVKKAEEKPVEAKVQEPQNNVRYEIPERTLRMAGVPESEINLNRVRSDVPSVPSAATGNWSFSASSVPTTTQSVVKPVNTSAGSATEPKRYPGDDNPINTSWGYYRTGKWAADAAKTLNNK